MGFNVGDIRKYIENYQTAYLYFYSFVSFYIVLHYYWKFTYYKKKNQTFRFLKGNKTDITLKIYQILF